jgi:hypothetical protein
MKGASEAFLHLYSADVKKTHSIPDEIGYLIYISEEKDISFPK